MAVDSAPWPESHARTRKSTNSRFSWPEFHLGTLRPPRPAAECDLAARRARPAARRAPPGGTTRPLGYTKRVPGGRFGRQGWPTFLPVKLWPRGRHGHAAWPRQGRSAPGRPSADGQNPARIVDRHSVDLCGRDTGRAEPWQERLVEVRVAVPTVRRELAVVADVL